MDANHPPLAAGDEPAQRRFVLEAVLADPVCRALLERLPSLGLKDWWLTAGAVFQNVWNARTGQPAGFGIKDYDIFYFDDADLRWRAEDQVIRRVAAHFEDLGANLEVRNQARVHLWYREHFGRDIDPFADSRQAIDCFAVTSCALAVTVDAKGGYRLYSPFGIDDALELHLRPGTRIAPREVYERKVTEYSARWPQLRAEPWPVD
ncbi:nucleotidyltransferase family protein [Glutamicibacter endophyticus]